MRLFLATAAVAALMLGAAHAEKRLFIIANEADGYGIDNCLATGAPCGRTVANTYCRSHEFAQALSFRKVDRDDITGAIPSDGSSSCNGGRCDRFVAIECAR
jgi:hypothetical protein